MLALEDDSLWKDNETEVAAAEKDELSSQKAKQVIRIKGRRVKKRPKRLHFDSDDSDENDKSCSKEQSNLREHTNKHKLYDIKHALQSKLLNTGKILSHWNENAAIDVNFIGATTSTIFNRIATTSQELLTADSKFDRLFAATNIQEDICDTHDDTGNIPVDNQASVEETVPDKVEDKQTHETKPSTTTKQQANKQEQARSESDEIQTDSQAQRIFDKNFGNMVETPAIVSSLNSWFSDFRAATKSAASVTVTHAMKTITDNAQSILKAPVSLLPVMENVNKPEEFAAYHDEQTQEFEADDRLEQFAEESNNEPEKVEADANWGDEWEDDWDEEPIQLEQHNEKVSKEDAATKIEPEVVQTSTVDSDKETIDSNWDVEWDVEEIEEVQEQEASLKEDIKNEIQSDEKLSNDVVLASSSCDLLVHQDDKVVVDDKSHEKQSDDDQPKLHVQVPTEDSQSEVEDEEEEAEKDEEADNSQVDAEENVEKDDQPETLLTDNIQSVVEDEAEKYDQVEPLFTDDSQTIAEENVEKDDQPESLSTDNIQTIAEEKVEEDFHDEAFPIEDTQQNDEDLWSTESIASTSDQSPSVESEVLHTPLIDKIVESKSQPEVEIQQQEQDPVTMLQNVPIVEETIEVNTRDDNILDDWNEDNWGEEEEENDGKEATPQILPSIDPEQARIHNIATSKSVTIDFGWDEPAEVLQPVTTTVQPIDPLEKATSVGGQDVPEPQTYDNFEQSITNDQYVENVEQDETQGNPQQGLLIQPESIATDWDAGWNETPTDVNTDVAQVDGGNTANQTEDDGWGEKWGDEDEGDMVKLAVDDHNVHPINSGDDSLVTKLNLAEPSPDDNWDDDGWGEQELETCQVGHLEHRQEPQQQLQSQWQQQQHELQEEQQQPLPPQWQQQQQHELQEKQQQPLQPQWQQQQHKLHEEQQQPLQPHELHEQQQPKLQPHELHEEQQQQLPLQHFQQQQQHAPTSDHWNADWEDEQPSEIVNNNVTTNPTTEWGEDWDDQEIESRPAQADNVGGQHEVGHAQPIEDELDNNKDEHSEAQLSDIVTSEVSQKEPNQFLPPTTTDNVDTQWDWNDDWGEDKVVADNTHQDVAEESTEAVASIEPEQKEAGASSLEANQDEVDQVLSLIDNVVVDSEWNEDWGDDDPLASKAGDELLQDTHDDVPNVTSEVNDIVPQTDDTLKATAEAEACNVMSPSDNIVADSDWNENWDEEQLVTDNTHQDVAEESTEAVASTEPEQKAVDNLVDTTQDKADQVLPPGDNVVADSDWNEDWDEEQLVTDNTHQADDGQTDEDSTVTPKAIERETKADANLVDTTQDKADQVLPPGDNVVESEWNEDWGDDDDQPESSDTKADDGLGTQDIAPNVTSDDIVQPTDAAEVNVDDKQEQFGADNVHKDVAPSSSQPVNVEDATTWGDDNSEWDNEVIQLGQGGTTTTKTEDETPKAKHVKEEMKIEEKKVQKQTKLQIVSNDDWDDFEDKLPVKTAKPKQSAPTPKVAPSLPSTKPKPSAETKKSTKTLNVVDTNWDEQWEDWEGSSRQNNTKKVEPKQQQPKSKFNVVDDWDDGTDWETVDLSSTNNSPAKAKTNNVNNTPQPRTSTTFHPNPVKVADNFDPPQDYQQEQQRRPRPRPSPGNSSWFGEFRNAAKTAAVTTMTHASRNWTFNPTNLLDSVVDNLSSAVGIPSAEEMAQAMRHKQNTQK